MDDENIEEEYEEITFRRFCMILSQSWRGTCIVCALCMCLLSYFIVLIIGILYLFYYYHQIHTEMVDFNAINV